MKFTSYSNLVENIENSNLFNILKNSVRKDLLKQLIPIFNEHKDSPLIKFIINRIQKQKLNQQNLKIKAVDVLDSYKLDPIVYEKLLHVKSSDVGPGEILIGLTVGSIVGTSEQRYDTFIKGLGKIEIKYLKEFTKTANVPTGSAESKTIDNSNLYNFLKQFTAHIKKNPDQLSGVLTGKDLQYFINDTLLQLTNSNENLSPTSFKLIYKVVKALNNPNISLDVYKESLQQAIFDAVGDVEYIMFIGEKIDFTTDVNNPTASTKGLYYLLPKKDLKYWMVYRTYKNNRLKITPFSIEKDFIS